MGQNLDGLTWRCSINARCAAPALRWCGYQRDCPPSLLRGVTAAGQSV